MSYIGAANDFREARRRANMEQIMSRFSGRSWQLLPYEEVRQMLKGRIGRPVGLQDIPIDAIVGSVGRYTDFTRSFLPLQDQDQERWARVQTAVLQMGGLPPIEVYQIGSAYFVRDGNHRVSVARQLGATQIQAYVTRIETGVPLSPDVQPDELILKAEYADFLDKTHLDRIRPAADLSVTVPGQYEKLREHIEVHRHYMGLEQRREIPYAEAVKDWYDGVYQPVVEAIRERGILWDFPERTEADLYLWVAEHRAELEEALGWEVEPGAAAADLAARFSPTLRRLAARLRGKIQDALLPAGLKEGPPPGQWRQERLAARCEERLFVDILVGIGGDEAGWSALDQALLVAQREGARLRGLHVVPTESQRDGETARAVQAEFDRRCAASGVPGSLVIQAGEVGRSICGRSRWTDLVVVNLAHPPLPRFLAKLTSGFRILLRRCPRPVLAVPGVSSPLSRALLAYDKSPKAQEALFVATYLAGQWQIPLVVVTVAGDEFDEPEALPVARQYLEEHGVPARFLQERGPVARTILKVAEAEGCDLIVVGGYRRGPAVEAVLDSAVNQLLRESRWPLLVCR